MKDEAILSRVYDEGGAWLEARGDREEMERRAREENAFARRHDLPWRFEAHEHRATIGKDQK